jgi:hypothetical protein
LLWAGRVCDNSEELKCAKNIYAAGNYFTIKMTSDKEVYPFVELLGKVYLTANSFALLIA